MKKTAKKKASKKATKRVFAGKPTAFQATERVVALLVKDDNSALAETVIEFLEGSHITEAESRKLRDEYDLGE